MIFFKYFKDQITDILIFRLIFASNFETIPFASLVSLSRIQIVLLRTFWFHFVFVYFEGQKLVRFSVRKMRIEHTENASI